MAEFSDTAFVAGRLGKAQLFAVKLAPLFELFAGAFETEAALRRPFLWLPVAAGSGVVLYLYADREPSLWLIAPATISLGVGAYLARGHRLAFYVLCGLCALFAGELSAALRTARVAAPAIDRVRIATLDGFIEEMDFRLTGARFILRVHSNDGLANDPPSKWWTPLISS
jgi:competence protein ComEC